jgi:hypothetical protein
MQKLAMDANKYQRTLTTLGSGEGISPRGWNWMVEASAELLGKLENVYQEGVRNAEQEARYVPVGYDLG